MSMGPVRQPVFVVTGSFPKLRSANSLTCNANNTDSGVPEILLSQKGDHQKSDERFVAQR